MRGSALWQRRQLAAMLVPPPRLPSPQGHTRSGLAEGAHLDLTPCESMESRAKKIFHDSVEHTHTEQDAYTRRQGALSNSGRFDTHAMPHLHHQRSPSKQSRRVQDIPAGGTCCFQPGAAVALGAPRGKKAPHVRIGNLVWRALALCRSHVISAQGRKFEDDIRCKREHRESEIHVPARYFWC